MRTLAATLILALSLAGPALADTPPPSKGAAKPAVGFTLEHATPAEVKAWLGEPAVASEEGKGAFWTYRLDDCALMIFFKDDGTGLHVSGVGAGPRKRADTAPDADACIANARR